MPTRDTPYGAYNFLVELNDGSNSTSAIGGFSDVSGIGTETTLMEYRQGNDKVNRVRKVP
ncbi:MAG: phage tail protein, partial [Synechococcales cyanobacterium RU_4_20]|nr:phage tail protein [Synechococcales cyanobacterium RU_4_20]